MTEKPMDYGEELLRKAIKEVCQAMRGEDTTDSTEAAEINREVVADGERI